MVRIVRTATGWRILSPADLLAWRYWAALNPRLAQIDAVWTWKWWGVKYQGEKP